MKKRVMVLIAILIVVCTFVLTMVYEGYTRKVASEQEVPNTQATQSETQSQQETQKPTEEDKKDDKKDDKKSKSDKKKSEKKETMYVSTPKITLRESPKLKSKILPVRYMEEVKLSDVVKKEGDYNWYRVYYKDERYYLPVKKDRLPLTEEKSSFEYETTTETQKAVVDTALNLCLNENTDYISSVCIDIKDDVYNFNCSGFVTYVLNDAMKDFVPTYNVPTKLSRMSQLDNIYNEGLDGEFNVVKVSKKDMQPGDVLFFRSQLQPKTSKEVGHCGIYLGNNEFVHCTSVWSDAVCIIPLSGVFKDTLLYAARFIPDEVVEANEKMKLIADEKEYTLYSEMDEESHTVDKLRKRSRVKVLFTDSKDWAYVKTKHGDKGFIKLENLK